MAFRHFSALVVPGFWFLASAASAAEISIPYAGLDNCHLAYEAYVANAPPPSSDPKITRVRIEVEGDEGGPRVIRESPVPLDAGMWFSGQTEVDSLSPGTYTFRIIIVDENSAETELRSQQATILERHIAGTPLFDVAIQTDSPEPIGCGYILVSESLTFDLGEHLYIGGVIRVEGTLVYQSARFDKSDPVKIGFVHPIDLASPPDGYYILFGAGSSVSGGTEVSIVAADATIANVKQLDLPMDLTMGSVQVLDSTVTLNFWDLLGSSQVWFDRCVFPNENFYTRTGDEFRFEDCIFPSGPTVNIYKNDGSAVFSECFFRGSPRIEGIAESECLFKDCEFAKVVWLDERTGPKFENNIFLEYIYFDGAAWLTNSEPAPVIEGNYFMGQSAIHVPIYGQPPTAKIEIGSNYYGDSGGPTRVYWDSNPDRLFLKDRGATVLMGFQGQGLGPAVTIAPHIEKGPGPRTDTAVPPRVWSAGVVFGQNTIPHSSGFGQLVAGRESVLCADVACTEVTLSDAEVYLEVNGERVEPTRGKMDLHRDLAGYGSESSIVRAQSTVNFIIPPQSATIDTIRLLADMSEAKGFAFKEEPLVLWETSHYPVLPAPERDLNIVVQPIRLYLYGFTGTPAPSATAMIQELSNLMPAMFPISDDEIHFVAASPITYTGVISNFAWIGTYSLVSGLAALLGSSRTLMNVASWIGDRPDVRLDFVVGLVPHNGLGDGIDGANTAIDRGILLVDESKPTAAIHEMGHAIGLHTGTEQYDAHPPDGLEVLGVTLFKTDDGHVPGFSGDAGRIRHMPAYTHSWYSNQGWIDVMGAQDVPVWPIVSTLDRFRSDFQSRLNVPKESVGSDKAELPAGMRTLFVRAMVEKIGDGTGEVHYHFVPGTIYAAPIDRGNQTYFEVADFPQQVSGQYEFKGTNGDGNRYDFQAFQLIPNVGPTEEKYDLWWATFLIANSVVDRYEIVSVETGETVLEYLPGGTVDNALVLPPPGATLGESVTISWNANSTASPLKRTGPAPPLTHHLLVSEDGGSTWQGVAGCIDGSSIELPTEFLRAGENISIRLQSTDGLQTVDSRIDNLRIENRPPSVRILAPKEGDQAPVGYSWPLYGTGYDIDDRELVEGWWTSSLDGFLGSGNSVPGIILSPGVHDLVFHATDSNRAEGTASVQIMVATGSQFDFVLSEESLRMRGPGSNPSHPGVEFLLPGATHGVDLSVRNDGSSTLLALSLYLDEPAKAEIMLASQTYELEAFETAILSTSFEATTAGEYGFRGEITVAEGRDPNPANNVHLWTFPAGLPEPTVTPTPTLFSTLTPTPTGTVGPGVYDLDGDHIITMLDLFIFSRRFGQTEPPPDKLMGDFNGDNECDARDLLLLFAVLR